MFDGQVGDDSFCFRMDEFDGFVVEGNVRGIRGTSFHDRTESMGNEDLFIRYP